MFYEIKVPKNYSAQQEAAILTRLERGQTIGHTARKCGATRAMVKHVAKIWKIKSK